MKNLIRKARIVISGYPLIGPLTFLFAFSLIVLLSLLLVQVRKSYDIVMPVGQGPGAVLHAGTPPEKTGHEILIINSYHRGYSWSDQEMDGIIETLKQSRLRITPFIEYLDCKHFPRMAHFDRLRDLFLQKYRGRNFPLVIVADNPALEFALRYRTQLFPKAAIVFCGINGYTEKMIEGQKNITGIVERLDIHGTMSIAMKLHPRTREVLIVHDTTMTGLLTRREAERQLKPFEGLTSFSFAENTSLHRLLARVKALPSDSLVLALAYSRDKEGLVVSQELFSRMLSDSSPVPVYGTHEERIGYGIVGGSMLRGNLHGTHAAEIALKVLSGTSPSSIPVELHCPPRTIFDYNQLVRFSIFLKSLPRDSVVVNRPVSFYARYPGLAVTTIGIMIVLFVGILVLGFNVYQRKIAEDEQKKLQAQLIQAQKMEAVGLLAGGVAHDFNNIMTAIIGYANLLSCKIQPGDPHRALLDHIQDAGERAARVTRSLLAFSRKQVFETIPVDLNEIVESAEKIIMPLIGATITFTKVLSDRRLTVLADSGQIEQVLMNLCTNARDAMPNGGRLTIETGEVVVDEPYRKSLLLEKTGRYGVISVSDTGTGMDERTRMQIFEPFFTTKEVGKGTGLGLSIAYGIIKQHHGIISVSSELGNGTMFKIFLPLVPAATKAASKQAESAVRGGRETILLSEDEGTVRSMISLMLKDAGYSVIEAMDGVDAVDKFMKHQQSISLLLTDVIMPKKNGPEAYAEIKQLNPGLKVLFMSGYASDMVGNTGVAAETVNFISKPILQHQLLEKIREILDG